MSNSLGTPLPYPPADGITSLRFIGNTDVLLVASWDGTVRLYNAESQSHRVTLQHGAPVLDAVAPIPGVVFSAGLDGRILRHDSVSGKHEILGQHESGVKCLEWVPSLGAVVSAGWDCKLCVWDARGRAGQPPRYSVELPGKAYSSSLSSSGRLVVATARRKLAVLDVGTLPGASASASDGAAAPAAPRMDVLDSPLRHQTRAVRCFPDGTGFALGSVEGRVAMEFWDEGHDAARYAFKCHRGPAADGSGDTIYPVHALAFHEPYGTFASGGGDGCVAAWDGQRKKRLALWQGYPTSIAALAFNKTGTLLAVASSYAFEQGECSHPPDAIYIRSVTDADVKPRPKVAVA